MQKSHRPKRIITSATVFALILSGCAIKIEPTDLTAVTVENDRSVIEQALGKPDEVVEAQGLTVARYTYDKGYYRPPPSGGGRSSPRMSSGYGASLLGELLIVAIALPIIHASRTSKAKTQQTGQLAAVYDADQTLLYAGALEEQKANPTMLTAIASRYSAGQSGDNDALIDLSKVTLIPGQKKTFLETAANRGSAEASFALGQAYILGAGFEQNDAKAVKWWLQAGENNYVPAYKKLGNAYQSGTGVERDLEQAGFWYGRAAEHGDEKAKEIASDIAVVSPYIDGKKPEDPEAKYGMALAYERGTVIPKNSPEAERLLKESADAGYAPAQALYGDKSSDPVEFLSWHRLAAEQGYAPSQTELGKRYLRGQGIERDREQAKLWLGRAAEAGDEGAIEALENIALNEDRVSKLQLTAQQGDAVSQQKLGHAYQYGQGVAYNMNKALQWYERAAASGDVDSQYLLGWFYENGTDIEHDSITALKWYSIADLGYPAAKNRTNSLKKKMTAAQIAEAERMAREWLEAHPQ